MVAESTNFWAKRKQRRTRSSFFARCPEVFAALGEDCGWEGNLNRRGRRFSQRNDWGVTQRYIYSPYGSLIVLNADFSTPPAGTQPISDYLYQGMTLDQVTGLYYARNRNYSSSLGVWISQDPLQYVNGANTYQMEMSGPVGSGDPWGESQDTYVPDNSGKHGGPHVDRYNPGGKNVGRYRPNGSPIPHGGVCPAPIPNSDRKKFKRAAEQLGKAVVVVGAGVAVAGGTVVLVEEVLPWLVVLAL